MLLRPTNSDVRVVARVVGQALTVLGAGTLALAASTVLAGDLDSATALLAGGGIAVALGGLARLSGDRHQPLSWTRGVVAAVAAWMTCSLTAAVPLYLSGHYDGYLDAVFDAMSGLTTTGLSVVQDLDHLPAALVLYRHGLELAGALAIILAGLTLLTAASATASSMQPGDVRDERILPNPARTWQQIGTVAAAFLLTGIVVCTVVVLGAGLDGRRALLHGISLAVSAATTGGFSATSQSVTYYHSAAVELVLLPLMLAGATSYVLHRAAWRGSRWRLARDIEVRTLAISMLVVVTTVVVGLARAGAQTDAVPLFRRGVFTAVAAHTTTGLQSVAPRIIATDWGLLAPAALVAAMTIGGMSGATAGGLKVLRIGIILKGLVADVRKVLLPESALVVSTFVRERRQKVTDAHVRSASTVLLVMLAAMLTSAVVFLFVSGSTDLTEALFVSAAAAGNGGLDIGAFGPLSPAVLKLGFLFLMLLGRLEWMAVFAALGFAVAGVRGRR